MRDNPGMEIPTTDKDFESAGPASAGERGGVGSLYVAATPIGNLSDLSERTTRILRSVPWVAAEDTRTTRVLLERIGSGARSFAVHQHNESGSAAAVIERLRRGEDVALVSDAGTPAVSDPGCRIVSAVLDAGLRVVVLPGPSAAIAMVSVSGLVEGAFHFEGFLASRARARDERLAQLARLHCPFVLFEAPHRIADTLRAIEASCGPGRLIAIGRELTKKFEEIHRCPASEAMRWLEADSHRVRGEFVLVVAPAPSTPPGDTDEEENRARELLDALLEELPPSRAVRVAQRLSRLPHRRLYQMALERPRSGEDS
jgi:16S rRNA (cytidine1402-2'-O)-methyltransferase